MIENLGEAREAFTFTFVLLSKSRGYSASCKEEIEEDSS